MPGSVSHLDFYRHRGMIPLDHRTRFQLEYERRLRRKPLGLLRVVLEEDHPSRYQTKRPGAGQPDWPGAKRSTEPYAGSHLQDLTTFRRNHSGRWLTYLEAIAVRVGDVRTAHATANGFDWTGHDAALSEAGEERVEVVDK